MNLAPFKEYSKYLRVPYVNKGRDLAGWDCYGLYRWLVHERFGILLPSYSEEYQDAVLDPAVGVAFSTYRPTVTEPVLAGTEQEGDGIVFLIEGVPWHCGYVMTPGTMLHARRGCGTVFERYTAPQWNKRIEGIYRCKS